MSFSFVVLVLLTTPPDGDLPFRLSSTDLKQSLIWSSECEGPDCFILGFGGQDQRAEDGGGRTRLKVNGEWESISADLRAKYILRAWHALIEKVAAELRQIRQLARHAWFEDEFLAPAREPSPGERLRQVTFTLTQMHSDEVRVASDSSFHFKPLHQRLEKLYGESLSHLSQVNLERNQISPQSFADFAAAIVAVEEAASLHGAEPLPRALSPIVYEPHMQRFIMFGGDHGDFLMNDLWLFDPRLKTWEVRVAVNDNVKPSPRANHHMTAVGDGKVKVSGGVPVHVEHRLLRRTICQSSG